VKTLEEKGQPNARLVFKTRSFLSLLLSLSKAERKKNQQQQQQQQQQHSLKV